ncbi:MAG TPA: HNH endonuclease signature motif containing protein, partial [Gemmatimonadales bacterium]|nr:HNH endonuclease signature motif containing protein [Gemmatimonadales bacterium]
VRSLPQRGFFVARRSRRGSQAVPPAGFRRSPGRSMQSHREWLLSQHGPVCAYCGTETAPDLITLDHVRPRRGQTAYDRPDNLVFACRDCNAAKADTPLVAFLMQRRSRGVFLLHYGEHLSEPLKELARQASERPMLPKDA